MRSECEKNEPRPDTEGRGDNACEEMGLYSCYQRKAFKDVELILKGIIHIKNPKESLKITKISRIKNRFSKVLETRSIYTNCISIY